MTAACITASSLQRLFTATAMLALAFAAGGCSFQLGSMLDHGGSKSDGDIVGSITPRGGDALAMAPGPEVDTALRTAAREVLARNEATISEPWENPRTGARGTVTPIAKPYTAAGLTCRDFLASYVRGGSEAWLQGEACRDEHGPWEVRSLKRWTSS
jgi:surface antigen